MPKHVSTELTYDAPLSEVSAMLADPAFRDRVLDAQHALSRTVTIDGGKVAMVYILSVAGEVPSAVAKFVGDTISVHHDETWDAGFTRGDIAVRLPGKPGEMMARATLAQRDGRTVESVRLTASVSLPLIGGRMEDLILSTFRKAFAKEQQVGTAWLKGQ